MKLGMIHQWCGECFDYVKGKGLSFIEICRNYDPETEEFIAHADEKEQIIYGDIDLDRVDAVREQLPLLKHRREELYK